MKTDEHGSGGDSAATADDRGRVEREFEYRVLLSTTAFALLVGAGFVAFGTFLTISSSSWTTIRVPIIAFGKIIIGIGVLSLGVRCMLSYIHNQKSAHRRIAFYSTGVTVVTDRILPRDVFIPYAETYRIFLEDESSHLMLTIVHAHGKVALTMEAFVNKNDFARVQDELAERTSLAVEPPSGRFQFTIFSLLMVTTVIAAYLGFLKYTSDDNQEFLQSVYKSLFFAGSVGGVVFLNFLGKNRTGVAFLKCFALGILVECFAIILLSGVDLKVYPFSRAVMAIVFGKIDYCIEFVLSGFLLSGIVFGVIGIIVHLLRRHRAASNPNHNN